MYRAVKIRLYPTKEQQLVLNQHFGCCRFVYNNSLSYKKELYDKDKTRVSKGDLTKRLTTLKTEEDKLWLKDVKAEVLQNQMDNLDNAYQKFFNGAGFPKFKKKSNQQSFTSKQSFKILDNSNKIVFLKNKIKFRCSKLDTERLRSNKIKRITWSKTTSNQFFASVLIDFNSDMKLPKLSTEIGVDLGLKSFLVTSSGLIIDNPKFGKKTQDKLIHEQRKLSRKVRSSNNKNKQRIKVAKIYLKIKNQRTHFIHQVTNKLINENQVIHLETLAINNMVKNHNLASSINDVCWGQFVSTLKYKANWTGRQVYQISRWTPSSKTCSVCGWIKEDLTLKDRVFKCEQCSHTEDRDLNASKNIMKFSRDKLARINASGEQSIDTRRRKKIAYENL